MGRRTRYFVLWAACTGVLCAQSHSGDTQVISGREPGNSPGSAQSLAPPAAGSQMTYDNFVERAGALRIGTTRAEIIAALGAPSEEGDSFLQYSLTRLPGFPGLPAPVGVQVFSDARIEMQSGLMRGPIGWGWMDTTGSPSTSAKPRR
jgi:hypothetical protein